MKKNIKLILLSLLFIFNISVLNAATVSDKVTIRNDSKWENTIIGYAHAKTVKKGGTTNQKSYISTMRGYDASVNFCHAAFGSNAECEYVAVKKIWYCPKDENRQGYATVKDCRLNCNNGNCALDTKNMEYKIYHTGKVTVPDSNTFGLTAIKIYQYLMEYNGKTDNAYCVQPAKIGPGKSGRTYCLNQNVNLSDCDDGLRKHYYCGFAQILYDTSDKIENADGSYDLVPHEDYHVVGAALRLWASFYSKYGKSGLGGNGTLGNEVPAGQEANLVTTPVYDRTVEEIIGKNQYSGAACEDKYTSSNAGLLCTNSSDSDHDSYTTAIQYFKKAYSMFNGGGKFLDGFLSSGDDSFDKDITASDTNIKFSFTWPEFFKEQWESNTFRKYLLDCSAADLLNPSSNCRAYVKIEGGDYQLASASCTKEKCDVDITYKKQKCENVSSGGGSSKWKFTVTLKAFTNIGYFREYKDCASPDSYQIMYTVGFNKVKDEKAKSSGGDSDYTFEKSVVVPCDCSEDKCNDFSPIDTTKSSCDGQGQLNSGDYDSYDKMQKSDPYMNCILNACNPADKEQFNVNKKYGLNEKVCNAYCRKEVVFYLANKRKVYAGMQFKYDIGPAVLGCEEEVDEIVKTDAALTSIVLQKRQCTSEIYYDIPNKDNQTWLQQYDKAVKEMMQAYKEWKRMEAPYDWQINTNGGSPQKVITSAKTCAETGSGNHCGSPSCSVKIKLTEQTLYGWPNQSYSDAGACPSGWGSLAGESYKWWTVSSGSEVGVNFNFNTGSGTQGIQSGSFNCGSDACSYPSCCTSYSCSCPADEDGNVEYSCCCSASIASPGSCKQGGGADENAAYDLEDRGFKAYKTKVDIVAQLLYDLQNCNFYVKEGGDYKDTANTIKDYYTDLKANHHPGAKASINKSGGDSSAKDLIMAESACTEEENECVTMEFEYGDLLYGKNLSFDKKTDLVSSKKLNNSYYCTNADDKNPDCYKYTPKQDYVVEGGVKTKAHDVIECEGARTKTSCKKLSEQLPTNDFATFTTVTETDFWLSNQYSTNAYTGLVDEGGGDSSTGLSSALGKWQFPVSNSMSTNGTTGSYDTKYHFDNVKIVVDDNIDLDYSCSYDVFNTTNLYDCATRQTDGNLDISACLNNCYELVNGVPTIKDGCSTFDVKDGDSKGYGFVYRNIDLSNVFPNSSSSSSFGKNNRPKGTNWSTTLGETVTKEIEDKGIDVFLNEENLKYSYILTPTAINRIREYNTVQELSSRGYQDANFISCELIKDTKNTDGLKGFYNCKSEFLEEISQPNNSYDVYTVKYSAPGRGGN